MPPSLSSPLPPSLTQRLAEQFGEVAARDLLKAMAPRKTTIRVNTLKSDDQRVMNGLRESGIKFQRVLGLPHAFVIENRGDQDMLDHPLNQTGQIYLQGVASMLPPLILAPQPGEIILDACAAPGSKTSQIAALMNNEGRLVAIEENQLRLGKLRHTLTVQGASVAESLQGDSRKLTKTFAPEMFDAILTDVPCSAEGRMDLTDRRSFSFWSEKNVREHAKLQQQILKGVIPLLKPGGRLVYSTCTLAPEENEINAAWILETFPHLKETPIKLPLQGTRPRKHGIAILPSQNHEGFYVASFRAKK
jgi:16S rRNA C967 or C1407 C5-methylase (RsmB/RsmF family)